MPLRRHAASAADQLYAGLRRDCNVGGGNNRRFGAKVSMPLAAVSKVLQIGRPMRRWILLIPFAGLVAAPHVAGAQTSVFIPLDHWAMPLIEHLIRAGVMGDPDPLTRPLRRRALSDALDSIDLNAHGKETRALLEELRAEFTRDDDGFHGGLDGFVGAGGRSHARRDPLFPDGDGGPIGQGGFQFWITQGPFALSTGGLVNPNIHRDPDYTGRTVFSDGRDRISGRGQNAYGSLETSRVEIVFGNLDRNWGPPGFHGLLFSNAPYSYDHLTVRLKTKYVWVETAVSQLDDVEYQGETHQRYWITHRLTGNLTDWLKLWINQATLLSGPNQQLEPWALNPFKLGHFSSLDEDRFDGVNNFVEGAFWLRAGTTTWNGSLLVDDYAFFSDNPIPNRLAGTLVAAGPLGQQASWSAGYTFVSSLAYRTRSPVEGVNRRGVGLGRNFSDYDQLTVRATHAAPFRSLVGGEVTFLRHGEGDLRNPWPDSTEFADLRFIHQGVSEKTLRLAATLHSRPASGFSIRGRAGVHFVRNAGNVQGATDTQFVGEIDVVKYFTIRF